MLDLPRLCMLPPEVSFSLQRGANGMQRHSNVNLVFNEFSIVTGDTQKATDVLTIFRLRPIHYCMGLIFLGMDAALVNVKAREIYFRTSPGTVYTFGFETIFRQKGKHFTDMYDMFPQGTAENNHIVEVHDNEIAFYWLQDAVHHAHEQAGCVHQATWQDSSLLQSEFSGEGHLLPVRRCDTNLLVTSHQVQFGEPGGALHEVE